MKPILSLNPMLPLLLPTGLQSNINTAPHIYYIKILIIYPAGGRIP